MSNCNLCKCQLPLWLHHHGEIPFSILNSRLSKIKRSQWDCPSTSKSLTPVHSFHGSFQGICLQINTNRLTDMSSIMARKYTLEIATTNWEKYLTIYSLWVNLNFFSIREKNRTYKNCFEKCFWFPSRRVYMWDAKVLWKKTVNTNGLTVNTLQCKIELWKMNFFLDPPVSILKAMNRKERLDI